jgi:hypothetical protein
MARYRRIAVWLIALAVAFGLPAAAEQKPAAKTQQPQPNQQQGQAAPNTPLAQLPALPDAFKLNLLIRSSIIALNQANQTGNYTVLQDLGAPAFRASNNSVRLAQIFSALRQRQLDLSPVLFFTPKLVAEPQINANGLLRLVGFFPTAPERVNFELIYQQIDGQWRLFGIGVNTSPAEVTSALPPAGAGEQPQGAASPAQAAQAAPTPPAAPDNSAAREAQAPSPKAAQKPDGAARPSRKQQAEKPSGAKKQSGAANTAPGAVVQNGATNNAARIDLANPSAAATGSDAAPKKPSGTWDTRSLSATTD